MAGCQVVCPEAPQDLRAGREDHGQEQAGKASWKRGPRCGAEGLSCWDPAGRQVSGLGEVLKAGRDASLCVHERQTGRDGWPRGGQSVSMHVSGESAGESALAHCRARGSSAGERPLGCREPPKALKRKQLWG